MITEILAAIDRGISLLRERQVHRRAFFNEVVDPIQKHILTLQDRHHSAFDRLARNLLDMNVSLAESAKEIRLEFQRQDALCAQLYLLPKVLLDPQSEIEREVLAYVSTINKALNFAPHESTQYRTIIKFVDLTVVAEEMSLWPLFGCQYAETEQQTRNRLLKRVTELCSLYNESIAEIAEAYLQLKRKCLV